jgi:hypothetical protein
MWPRGNSSERSGAATLIPAALAALALVWLLISIPSLLASLPSGQTLQTGFYLQAGAIVFIAAITTFEIVRRWQERKVVTPDLTQEGGVAIS